MTLIHGKQVNVGENVGIVHEEWLIAVEEWTRLEDAATSVEQEVSLVADVDIQSKVVVLFKKINDFLSKVVDVDSDVVETCLGEFYDYSLKHGLAAYFH